MTTNATGTITFNSVGNNEVITNTGTGTLATGTMTLSGTSIASQTNTYVTMGPVTSLTTTGGTILGTLPGSLSAPSTLTFRCIATGTWVVDHTIQTLSGTLTGTGTTTFTVPLGCHPWIQDTNASITNVGSLTLTVSGTLATVSSTNSSDASTVNLFY